MASHRLPRDAHTRDVRRAGERRCHRPRQVASSEASTVTARSHPTIKTAKTDKTGLATLAKRC
eukprot:9459747-Pyramimonas_sp.AAC.1